jgi:hypothetical protein
MSDVSHSHFEWGVRTDGVWWRSSSSEPGGGHKLWSRADVQRRKAASVGVHREIQKHTYPVRIMNHEIETGSHNEYH